MSTNNNAGLAPPPPTTKISPTANTKPNRLPAPTLFVGPPSRNASQLSISRTVTHDSRIPRDPLIRQKSALSRPVNADHAASGSDADSPHDLRASGLPKLKKASEKTVEARWKEMQSTLNEVELTAQSSTHVFGESHTAALDQLRKAQVELARAWGRGNEEEKALVAGGANLQSDLDRHVKGADEEIGRDQYPSTRKRGDTVASASTALSDESSRSDFTSQSGTGGGRNQLEDETAQDIKLASERRAANEAYFSKVDSGVKDVVAKLEAVAEAMRGVEAESRSLWSNSDKSLASTDNGVGGEKRPTSSRGKAEEKGKGKNAGG